MITLAQLITWLNRCQQKFEQQSLYLSELDSAIGDGDHGANMARGFTKVIEKLNADQVQDIGALFKLTAMTLLSSVGGASGPLFGSFFLKAATKAQGKTTLSLSELTEAITTGAEAVAAKGKAVAGEKTMCDVWFPVVQSLTDSTQQALPLPEALSLAKKVAHQAMEATIPMLATKGRASYLGERSIGHQDPGATSSYYLIELLADTIKEEMND